MKKTLLILSLLLCCTASVLAVPAWPGWQTITQSDGSTLQVQAVGNAFNHAILTRDGLTVARGHDGDFYYTSSVTGLTAVRAHEAGQRTASETAFVNAQRSSLTMTVKNRQFPVNRQSGRLGMGGSNAESGVPAMGQRNIPIILVEFSDIKFNNTREAIIEAMLMGNESVGQYFRDQSNGLYEPEFDVYGIYSLSHNRQYYGANDSEGNDMGLGSMVTEACQMAADDGVSFKTYDTNNDDFCDVVIVIYAGVGEAQASTVHPEAVWPCNWTLDAAVYYSCGGQGAFRPAEGEPYINTFAVFNELHGSKDSGRTIDGIGTFAHEFGHCLGLPDFYDTGNGNHFGMGSWDIMCLGCYNNDSYTPSGYSAYEKNFMGWVDLITPRPDTYYTLPVWNLKSAATDKAVCITSDLNQNEFFILENRKRQGWDRYLPGDGIMITHVTYDAARWRDNTPNNQDIQLMTLVPADNSLYSFNQGGDLWPRYNNNSFTDTSTPAARLYMTADGNITGNAGYLGQPVTEMAINADGSAGFWYMKGIIPDPIISISSEEIGFGGVMLNNSGTRTVRVRGRSLTGDITLHLNDANGVFSVSPTVISNEDTYNGCEVTVTFAPKAIQNYNATLTLKSEGAEDVTVMLTGNGLIEGYTPVMLPADENAIGLTQFRADWTDNTPDQNIESYTLEVMTKPNFTLLETADFSNLPDVLSANGTGLLDISVNYWDYLPAGWSGTTYLSAYDGSLILSFGGTVKSPNYDFTGHGKMTIVFKGASYYYDHSTVSVSSSIDTQEVALDTAMADYTVVLNCADMDAVTIKSLVNYTSIKQIDVYAGEQPTSLRQGDASYRLITGITDKYYTVTGLNAADTYIYKVKGVWADGTESPWSNVETVTLFDNGHTYEVGDVDHDGMVIINDVTALIDYLLDNNKPCCTICGDVNGDGQVSIDDVTVLIDRLLAGN